MSECLPGTPWPELWDLCTPEYRLQLRVDDLTKQASKKLHKPRITASRRYPHNYVPKSTKDYVREYFALNDNSKFGGINAYGADDHLALYQPLSTRVTPVEGEYSEQVED